MTLSAAVRPRGPYSLQLTARRSSDATRRFRDGVLDCVLPGGERAQAWQRPDGTVCLRADSAEGLERLRFVLALDDDHTEFLRRFADDALIGRATREFRGLRQVRTATVAQSVLRALCGQLIDSRRARALEWRIVRGCAPAVGDGLHEPPDAAMLSALSPAELRSVGLHARRAATLVRVCRSLDPERLRGQPTPIVAARLERERGLGPWSAGVICLEGLGRRDLGLVGDLGLVKLLSALHGRRAEAAETVELLEPYGEWAGLASVYLLLAFSHGLVELPGRSAAPRGAARFLPAAAF